jgi:hypothetical protein
MLVGLPVAKSPTPAAPGTGLLGGNQSMRVADTVTPPVATLVMDNVPTGAAKMGVASNVAAATIANWRKRLSMDNFPPKRM